MSDNKNMDRLRPRFHFSPRSGWMNDPNGLLFYEGIYHMFYQYDPDNIIPVSMHWGHATSRDLIHWQEQPVALFPDENGVIYSGSMVVDRENVSSLGNGEAPPLLAFFTYHKERESGYSQSQGVAYSCDHGRHFKKYPRNPILTYAQKDFRDPMVFFHEPSGRWVMLLVAGRSVLFYTSPDLMQWEQCSSFLPQDPPAAESEIWECPCLFSLSGPGGGRKWVLAVSVFTVAGERYGMRYFVGAFDGVQFHVETPWDTIHMLDSGWDFYAGAVFGGLSDRVIMMSWVGCWYYARKTPATNFRGSMSLPRELYLTQSANGVALAQRFAPEVDRLFASPTVYRDVMQASLPESGCRIQLSLAETGQKIRLTNRTEMLVITLDTENKTVGIDRSGCDEECFCGCGKQVFTAHYAENGECALDMILDRNSLELLSGDGRAACTIQYYTANPLISLEMDVPAKCAGIYRAG